MATEEKTRVVFTFNQNSLSALEEIKEIGNYSTLAETVHDSLQIMRTLQNQAQRGYHQVIVRNPWTENERLLDIPTIRAISRKGK